MGAERLSRPPSVDKIARALSTEVDSVQVRSQAARLAVEHFRANGCATHDEIVAFAFEQARVLQAPRIANVVNMSGVVLHTGLGRAPLGAEAVAAIARLGSHCTVEFDLETGGRGDRQTTVRDLLRALTACEDALVVNNCAAAVFLTLAALCQGRDVVLSRGEMVEIGGSFRMPDIVSSSGCRLVEVGCTNRTTVGDFEAAVNDTTVAYLRCHPSNYRIVGFTQAPSPQALAESAHKRGLLLIDDVGHGCLSDLGRFGLPPERTLREAVADGADIVLASCDKLMGGPQAGVVLGRTELVRRIACHPLARAVRVDKLTLAALEATLRVYVEGREHGLPIWRSASRPLSEVKRSAKALAAAYPRDAVVEPGMTEMGGGSMPGKGIQTWRAGLASSSPDSTMAWLRNRPTPVIGRIENGRVWLDPRTCEPDEVKAVARVLANAPL